MGSPMLFTNPQSGHFLHSRVSLPTIHNCDMRRIDTLNVTNMLQSIQEHAELGLSISNWIITLNVKCFIIEDDHLKYVHMVVCVYICIEHFGHGPNVVDPPKHQFRVKWNMRGC